MTPSTPNWRHHLLPWYTPMLVAGMVLTLYSDYQRVLVFRAAGYLPTPWQLVLSHTLLIVAVLIWVATRKERRRLRNEQIP